MARSERKREIARRRRRRKKTERLNRQEAIAASRGKGSKSS